MMKMAVTASLLLAFASTALSTQSIRGEVEDILIPDAKVGLSPSYGSIVALRDGRLLWTWGKGGRNVPAPQLYGNHSSDGGKTWSDPFPLLFENGQPFIGLFTTSLVRLRSGSIGQAVMQTGKLFFHISRDEGKSWSQGIFVHAENERVSFTNDRALVLSTGRVVLPVYTGLIGPKLPVRKPRVQRFGAEFDTVAGDMAFSYVIFSDDEGKTWKRSDNEVYVALDKGTGGLYATYEPAVAELADGRLVMFVRTNLGRFYRSYSEDKGVTWLEPERTPLLGPPAPCSLTRMPGTNDLLAIWTQVSAFEVMQGLYRHRLSCAVSKDDGVTWDNFKNLESLDDTSRVEDETPRAVLFGVGRQPLDRKRYHRAPGPLRASYPTCIFLDGKAIISYGLSTLGDKETITGTYGMDYDEVVRKLGMGPEARANKLRIIPIGWFYAKSGRPPG